VAGYHDICAGRARSDDKATISLAATISTTSSHLTHTHKNTALNKLLQNKHHIQKSYTFFPSQNFPHACIMHPAQKKKKRSQLFPYPSILPLKKKYQTATICSYPANSLNEWGGVPSDAGARSSCPRSSCFAYVVCVQYSSRV